MPIYEYCCHKCGRTTEVMQKFSDQPLTRCPHCSGRLSKVISNCAFHLKGSGWYVTDYKKKDSAWKEKSSTEKKDKTETPSSTETKTKTEEKKS